MNAANAKPGVLMMIGGGALMFIGTFLDWLGFGPGAISGTEVDYFGLQGVFVLVMGAGIAALGVIRGFAPQVALPDSVGGIAIDRIVVIFGLAAFLVGFSLMFAELDAEIGLFAVWIGGALAVAGGTIESRAASAAPASSY